jgi:molybdenum-dependent DNA-binding transcriptional regulator ModE
MGRKSSIDEATGERLLAAYQRLESIAAAAREVGVSESAARRYFDELPKAATPTIVSQRHIIETAGTSLFDTRAALGANYERTINLITQLEAGIQLVRTGEREEYITYTPPITLVAALREAREHIQAGMKLYQLLISVDETRKFQQAVLESIGEADDATRQRIIAKLHERRALELAL